jgi:hypothetical protein
VSPAGVGTAEVSFAEVASEVSVIFSLILALRYRTGPTLFELDVNAEGTTP